MENRERQDSVINPQSRRRFINKVGILTGGVILGSVTLLDACGYFAPNSELKLNEYTIPEGATRIDDLQQVKAALQSEKEQFQSLSKELTQILLDMNELYDSFERLQDSSDLSQESMLALQMLMDKKDQVEKVLSNILKVFQNTQRDLVANLK
jgi:hypothetical protein